MNHTFRSNCNRIMLTRSMANFLGLKDEPQWKAFLFRWLSLSLVLHLITSIFSIGHHSADEYFQILEFLSFKLGNTPAHHLPTEFREQMRPWMQPGIYWCMTRIWQFFGVYNPFTWATSFRMFSGLIGWLSAVGLALCSRFWFADMKARKLAVISLALIWFFPVLHVRPSSENLAGSTFLLALCLADLTSRQKHDQKSWTQSWAPAWFAVGGLLGLSFEFRFQMGFMIAGIFAWILIYLWRSHIIPLRSLVALSLGSTLIFLLGRWVDSWGYGHWVLSPYNYFSFNLIRGEVSKYGTAPWWDVFRMSATETWPVLGLILAVATAIAWFRHPRHILTWSQVPFFLVHEFIAHKELRFFFPIALAGPILLTLSLYSSPNQRLLSLEGSKYPKGLIRLARWTWNFFLVNNIAALIGAMFMPFARTVQFYQGLYQIIPPLTRTFDLYTLDRDPYILLGNPVFFYRPTELRVHKFTSYPEFQEIVKAQEGPIWLFDTRFHLPVEAESLLPICHPVYQTFPPFVEKMNWGNWLERTLTWSLYRCERKSNQ